MPKRCETINNGCPCTYLTGHGCCLMDIHLRPDNCPARETIKHEEKDSWIGEFHG